MEFQFCLPMLLLPYEQQTDARLAIHLRLLYYTKGGLSYRKTIDLNKDDPVLSMCRVCETPQGASIIP